MRFITQNAKQDADEPVRDTDAPLPRNLSASIENAVGQHFRQVDMPRWKYRQIIREGKHSADLTMTETGSGRTDLVVPTRDPERQDAALQD